MSCVVRCLQCWREALEQWNRVSRRWKLVIAIVFSSFRHHFYRSAGSELYDDKRCVKAARIICVIEWSLKIDDENHEKRNILLDWLFPSSRFSFPLSCCFCYARVDNHLAKLEQHNIFILSFLHRLSFPPSTRWISKRYVSFMFAVCERLCWIRYSFLLFELIWNIKIKITEKKMLKS